MLFVPPRAVVGCWLLVGCERFTHLPDQIDQVDQIYLSGQIPFLVNNYLAHVDGVEAA